MVENGKHSGYFIIYENKYLIQCKSEEYFLTPPTFHSYSAIWHISCDKCKKFIGFSLDLEEYKQRIINLLTKLRNEFNFIEMLAGKEPESNKKDNTSPYDESEKEISNYQVFIREFYLPFKNELISIVRQIGDQENFHEIPINFILKIFSFLEKVVENFRQKTKKEIQIYICLDCFRFYAYVENMDDMYNKNYLLEFLGNREWIESFEIRQPPYKCNICQKRILRIY